MRTKCSHTVFPVDSDLLGGYREDRVPTERTQGESRVALAPHAVYELTRAGHRVFVEAGAGEASSIADERYEEAGARLVREAARIYADSEIVVKVYGPVEESTRT